MLKKIGPVLAAAAALGALALGGVAQAAPVYSDTSVQIFDNPVPLQHIDAITAIPATASYTPLTPPPSGLQTALLTNNATTIVPAFSATGGGATVTYAAVDSLGKPLTFSIANTVNIPSTVGISINGGTVTLDPTIVPGCPGVAVTNANTISLTVKVTDGTAVGFETLTAMPTVVVAPSAGCPGNYITSLSVTASTDTVTLSGTNDNTTGRVFFSPAPSGVTFTGANLPAGTGGNPGVTLAGNVLSATSTVPGAYNDIAVTATDAAGATATDIFDVYVKGAVVTNDTPRLSHGHAACGVNHSRMNVFYEQDGSPSWDHFTIVGPGKINGHQGWVFGHLGLNEAVYGGLLAGHGYTVYYQPVTGPGSTTPIPGAHWGYVYFVSGRGC